MNEEKPVLSIETSGSLCGACVYYSDEKYFEANVLLKNSHAEKLFDAIDYVMKSANVRPEMLDVVAVSAGPGSFTGLRIGMSAAKGIAFGAGLPITAVPTFEALAMEASSVLPEGTEFIIANKVNVEEIYYAKFFIKSNNYIFADTVRIINYDEFEKLAENSIVLGNVVNKNLQVTIKKKINLSSPSAKFVAKWCKQFGYGLFNFDYMEPEYLKNFIISVSAKLSKGEQFPPKPSLDGKESKNA